MKTTVKEFNKFIDDDEFWPKGAYYDYDSFIVNGVEVGYLDSEDKDAIVVIKGGEVKIDSSPNNRLCKLDYFFRKWRKKNEQ